jgi:signal peptidase I
VREELVAWVKTVLSAAVYAILIVTFGFQVARVEGQSMAPTLEDQDRLIVNKLLYRWSAPRRGDIVMLYYPRDPSKSFVKRVIAEEGDTIRIVDGRVYVNDVPVDDSYVLPEFRNHEDYGPLVIEPGYYFVMGDHRNNSSDSRHWGMVPKRYIIGRSSCAGAAPRASSEPSRPTVRVDPGVRPAAWKAACGGVELLDQLTPAPRRPAAAPLVGVSRAPW